MKYSDWLEHDLLELAKNGDAEAFAELVGRTRTMCLKVALSIVKDPLDAEDHVQTACLKAWQKIDLFREDAKFSTWMTRIVTNECLMALRSRRRESNVSIDSFVEEGVQIQLPDKRSTPEEDLAAAQISSLLLKEIHRVPAFLRGVLVAAEIDRAPMEDIAARFGISVEAVKSRLYRARRELRRRLEKHTGRLGAATFLSGQPA